MGTNREFSQQSMKPGQQDASSALFADYQQAVIPGRVTVPISQGQFNAIAGPDQQLTALEITNYLASQDSDKADRQGTTAKVMTDILKHMDQLDERTLWEKLGFRDEYITFDGLVDEILKKKSGGADHE
jgi:hypothetical protein